MPRILYKFYFSEDDYNLIRDYCFTQGLKIGKKDFSPANGVDDIFEIIHKYRESPSAIVVRSECLPKGDYPMSILIDNADIELLKSLRREKVMRSVFIDVSLTDVFVDILDVFRRHLTDISYEFEERPEFIKHIQGLAKGRKSNYKSLFITSPRMRKDSTTICNEEREKTD